MAKRLFDILASLTGLIILSPLLVLLIVMVRFRDGSPIFFFQERVGRHGVSFSLIKFRTMRPDSESQGQLSIGARDPRVTATGHVLRKTKMDELPQLWNVLKGDMSLVGPRPEVPRYVKLYSPAEKAVLQVRPGITDEASLAYFNESEVMAQQDHPEQYYIDTIMRDKLRLNMDYLARRTFFSDLGIIGRTIARIFQ